jgi:hypothetical protein
MTHLTDRFTDQQLATLTNRLKDEVIDPRELADAISDLGDVHYMPARPLIERCLSHSDEWVRRNAIQALTVDFKAQEHRATCETMIEKETDFDVRLCAISGLGSLLFGTNDIRGLQLLARIVRDSDEDLGHRECAYESIQSITGVPVPNQTSRLRDVDWGLIARMEEGGPL